MSLSSTLSGILSASNGDRTQTLRNAFTVFDRNGDSRVTGEEFARVFARMEIEAQEHAGMAGAPTGFGTSRTVFDCVAVPSFSPAYATGLYNAVRMMNDFDGDNSGFVTLAEMTAMKTPPPEIPADDPAVPEPETPPEAPATPATPAARADDLLAVYDKQGKGFVELADVAQAWTDDPSLGDASAALAAIEAWDLDGDGLVARDELIRGFEYMDLADGLLAAFDPTGTGFIDLAALTDADVADLSLSRSTLSSWDFDKDEKLTRAEIIQGLKTPAAATTTDITAALLDTYDADKSGGLDEGEFAAMTADRGDGGAGETFAAWDEDADGIVSATELASGIDLVRRAQKIVADYDLTNKGWFDAADIQAALDAASTPSASTAADIMAWWDADGDGRVTAAEVVAGLQSGGYVAGKQEIA